MNKITESPFLLLGLILFVGYGVVRLAAFSYTKESVVEYKAMKQPVKLYWKKKNTFWYSVVLIDSSGQKVSIGNMSDLANDIGNKFDIGETVAIK
jgi:hypothetical protein